MIYILLFFLIALLLLFFIFFDRNILSPSVIGTAMFLVSTIIAALNAENWKFTLSPLTVIVVTVSLLFFGSGEMLVHLHLYKHSQFKKIKYTDTTEIKVRPAIIFLITGIASILPVNYYNETVKLAVQAGYNKKDSGALMLAYARTAVLNQNGQYDRLSRFAGYSATLPRAVAYVFSYIYLHNRIIIKKSNIRENFLYRKKKQCHLLIFRIMRNI